MATLRPIPMDSILRFSPLSVISHCGFELNGFDILIDLIVLTLFAASVAKTMNKKLLHLRISIPSKIVGRS